MTARTMSYQKSGTKSVKKPCGCGGGCGNASCECQSTKCGDACGCTSGLLIQPHFFAGQLLTDDDLQALTTYVLAKQRLHNRFVVGSGVACGLAVTCHPCDPGKVMVEPGYAIDCCGNDIYVPCPVELDINAMVRDLKFRRLGMDCGDPCDDPLLKGKNGYAKNARQKKSGSHAESAQHSSTHHLSGKPGSEQHVPGQYPSERYPSGQYSSHCYEPVDRYCLYVVYCESPTDPVAPYTADESCSSACQPSRVREGYRFELRCPEQDDSPASILDRIHCCLGDLKDADPVVRESERALSHSHSAQLAMQAYAKREPPPLPTAMSIRQVMDQFSKDPVFAARDEHVHEQPAEPEIGGLGSHGKETSEAVLRRTLDNVQTLGSAIVRFELSKARRGPVVLGQGEVPQPINDELEESVRAARGLLQRFLDDGSTIKNQVTLAFTSPFERFAAEATVDNTLKYISPNVVIEELQSPEGYLYAYNVASSKALNSQKQNSWSHLQNWLIRKIHECPPTTECGLLEELKAIVIPPEENPYHISAAASTLMRVLIRYVLDCICSALLPTCSTCEDPAVKLACFEVDNCAVNNICNLERTFLITGPNIRYWFPFLHWLGQFFEKICCECSKTLDCPATESLQFNEKSHLFLSGTQYSKQLEGERFYVSLLRLLGFASSNVSPTINLGNSFAVILRQIEPFITCLFGPTQGTAVKEVHTTLMARFFEHPQAQMLLKTVAQQQLSNIEARVEELAAHHSQDTEQSHDRIKERVREVEEELDKRLTASKLASSSVIKELKASLTKLQQTNDDLVARLKKLEKGPRR